MNKKQILLADPPWSYDAKGTRMAPEYAGEQRKEACYKTLSIDSICNVGKRLLEKEVIDTNAVLFLWITNNMLIEGRSAEVCKAYGFKPKQLISWVKTSKSGDKIVFGGGSYTRGCTEHCVLAIRGKMKPKNHNTKNVIFEEDDFEVPNVIFAARGKHSSKPQIFYNLIESLFDGEKLELFARERRPGWSAWGNEIQSDVVIDNWNVG